MQDDALSRSEARSEARPTEASLATQRLREEILTGVVAPGAKLKLVPLAKRYEISRGPVREAASRLAAEGLVCIVDQRGFRVAPVSKEDLLDVTRTRQQIEGLALKASMAQGDLAWEGQLMAAWHMLDQVTEHDGSAQARQRFTAHHEAFHSALVAACTSTYLMDFRARLYALSERYRHLAAERYALGRARDVRAEHKALLQATLAREERACQLLSEHLGETADTLLEQGPGLFADQPSARPQEQK